MEVGGFGATTGGCVEKDIGSIGGAEVTGTQQVWKGLGRIGGVGNGQRWVREGR